MSNCTRLLVLTLGVSMSMGFMISAQRTRDAAAGLTDADRAAMQGLVAAYARALGSCAAEEYADLFTPDGSFASGPRGTVAGRSKLIELVQSERHCNDGSARTPRAAPVAVITPSPKGATGTAPVGAGSYYADVFVKTPQGWRFKSRTFISAQEEAAKLMPQDFLEIRRLAGDAGQFEDVYSETPEGTRFRSSGVVITPSPEGIKGRAYLKGGGYYDDVYEKGSHGWRFKSRRYVAAGTAEVK
jgi:hypothetical protein